MTFEWPPYKSLSFPRRADGQKMSQKQRMMATGFYQQQQ
jgi:hypothetical protein